MARSAQGRILEAGNNDWRFEECGEAAAMGSSIVRLLVSRPSSRMLAVLAMIATTGLWGVSYPLVKQLLATFPPCTLAVLRLAIALLAMVPMLLIQGRRPRIGRQAALLGVTGVAAFQLLQNYGLAQMPAGSAVIVLFGSAAVMTTLLGRLLLGETCSTAMSVALLGSAAGVVLVAVGAGGGMSFPIMGMVLILASAFSFSLYAVIGRHSLDCDLTELNAGALIVGLIVMLPFAAYERPDTRAISVSSSDMVALLVLGALVTVGAYSFWSYSNRNLQANEASVLCSIEPAFGLFFAWMLLRESVSVQELLGAAVIVASCLLVARGESRDAVAMESGALVAMAL